jgi:molybdopterin converting factor small subunit
LDSVSVNVSAFGLWQMLLGPTRRRVEASGSTLRDLLKALNDMCTGMLSREVLVADGSLDPRFKIFVNGSVANSLSTELSDGDEVLLFSVIDGG